MSSGWKCPDMKGVEGSVLGALACAVFDSGISEREITMVAPHAAERGSLSTCLLAKLLSA